MGEVTKRGCEVSFYPVRKCEYVRHEIRVDAGMTAQDVEECLKRDLTKKEPYEKYHVILTGGYTPGAEPGYCAALGITGCGGSGELSGSRV